MLVMFFFSFFSPRVLGVPSTDRPETLPHGRNLAYFYNASPKIGGHSPQKIWGPKTYKILVDFGPLQTLIANISGTAKDIQNRPTLQTMAIPPAFITITSGPVPVSPQNIFHTTCRQAGVITWV